MAKISINIKDGSIKKESVIVGIDLGTTNSLVAICDPQTGEPKALTENKQAIVPSVIHISKDNQKIVGNAAKSFLVSHPERTLYSIKRLMGRSYKDLLKDAFRFHYRIIDNGEDDLVKVQVDQTFYNPIELSSFILKELKHRAGQVLNATIEKAVITVPAYFNDSQRQATRDAGKLAGLDVLRIINEPTAASLAYGIGLDPSQEKTIAVYDLGGGTFDVSILRIQQGIFEVLATHGDTFLGGDDFDKAIERFWLTEIFKGKNESDFLEDNSRQELRLLAEKAKKILSVENDFYEQFTFTEGQTVELKLSRTMFESLIAPLVEKSMQSCSNALLDAGIEVTEIQEVVLVGGSTRVPYVLQQVERFFKNVPVHNKLDPDEVVALGAAVEADILAGNRKDMLLLDVTPLSLGIETLGGLMDFLITRNSKIPCKAARQYTTSKDGQTAIQIHIYQGEREMVESNRKLASFELKGIPAMPAGLPKIEVGFTLDADGVLSVDATELRSGVKQEIKIKPAYGLTDQEVENMLLDSLTNAKSDMDKRMLSEALTEANQLVQVTEKFISKHAEHLTPEELNGTNDKIKELKKALFSSDRNLILHEMDALNSFTKDFAERIMDIAIASSLKGNKIV